MVELGAPINPLLMKTKKIISVMVAGAILASFCVAGLFSSVTFAKKIDVPKFKFKIESQVEAKKLFKFVFGEGSLKFIKEELAKVKPKVEKKVVREKKHKNVPAPAVKVDKPVETPDVESGDTSGSVVAPSVPVTPAPVVPTPEPVTPPTPAPVPTGSNYKWHYNIVTTEFWIGELPSEDNNYISNVPTAWESPVADSVNDYYVALPYNDLEYKNNQTVNKDSVKFIPWYDPADAVGYKFYSYMKNRWVMVKKGDKVVYGQVEDTGPYLEDDFAYVFGDADLPANTFRNKSGLDISPAMDEYIGLDGLGVTDWKFVEFEEVPDGPWRIHVETEQCHWED
jgi:hypothetical protein